MPAGPQPVVGDAIFGQVGLCYTERQQLRAWGAHTPVEQFGSQHQAAYNCPYHLLQESDTLLWMLKSPALYMCTYTNIDVHATPSVASALVLEFRP